MSKPFIRYVKSFKNGFTLLELMIVVIILAILAAIAMPSYANYLKKSHIKAAQTDLISLSLVYENYYQRNLSYPNKIFTSTTALMDPNSGFPQWAPSQQDIFEFSSIDNGKGYELTATGKHGSNLSGCTLTIDQNNVRNATNCGGITW